MLLERRNAVIYGGGGAVGGAVARAFAREGATVFLTGRRLAAVEAVAEKIRADGGTVHPAQVDALDEVAVERHADAVVETAGSIDVSFNATGNDPYLGTPLVDLSRERFCTPLMERVTTQFLTARAAARRMTAQGSGVILMVTATPARMAVPLTGSFGVACAALEALSRSLAAELGPHGVRLVCLRSGGSPDSPGVRAAFEAQARSLGTTTEELQASIEDGLLARHLPTLAMVADVAAFVASDRASAMTGAVVNLTSGAIVD
jgi:NAD(P)-dependent dehydrogenase (short-subunit alcohol dehydrogenase family)